MAVDSHVDTNMALDVANRNAERIAKLEGSYQHLATKADVEKLRSDIGKLRSDLTWRIVLAMSVLTAIFFAIVRLPATGV